MHIYSTIKSHPLLNPDDAKPDADALASMREKSKQYPACRWAAAQCVDLSSRQLGHLKFFAVGPNNSIPCINQLKCIHWSYYFVGFVNLETGVIEPTDAAVPAT